MFLKSMTRLSQPSAIHRVAFHQSMVSKGPAQKIAPVDVTLEDKIRRCDLTPDQRIQSKVCDVESAIKLKTRPNGLVWLNNAICEFAGKKLMVARMEHYPYWRKSLIGIMQCDDTWDIKPKSGKLLDVPGRLGRTQAEDPRLLVHDGELLMPYTDNRRQWLARLNSKLEPTVIHTFFTAAGLPLAVQEKNWSFFSHWSGLYCVYSIVPHIVLKYGKSALTVCSNETWTLPWPYGHPRGGASCVLHDGLYWHWFHSSHNMAFGQDDCRWQNSRRYHVGVYAFNSKPPFRPVAYTQYPILSGFDSERESLPGVNRPSEHSVVFCCGAIRNPTSWVLSYGENDMRCRIATVPDEVLKEKLIWL